MRPRVIATEVAEAGIHPRDPLAAGGATAVGKSRLAWELTKRLGADVPLALAIAVSFVAGGGLYLSIVRPLAREKLHLKSVLHRSASLPANLRSPRWRSDRTGRHCYLPSHAPGVPTVGNSLPILPGWPYRFLGSWGF